MKEIICINIGQAGIQIGNACWELFCLEHEIQPDGNIHIDDTVTKDSNNSFNTFFTETKKGKYVSRSLFIDSEPSVIDEVRTGTSGQLFHPDQLISGKEDSSSIYSMGNYILSRDLINIALNHIRKLVENCSNLQGFFFLMQLEEELALDFAVVY